MACGDLGVSRGPTGLQAKLAEGLQIGILHRKLQEPLLDNLLLYLYAQHALFTQLCAVKRFGRCTLGLIRGILHSAEVHSTDQRALNM